MAYAIIRHHVIDVRVAGGRALAFAALSAIPVAAFSIIDWALSNKVQRTRFGVVAEVCVAIAFGFWVNSIQHRVDAVIEALFFRRSRIAEERMRFVAQSIAKVEERTVLDETLVREPLEALDLLSSALFLREGASYVRVADRNRPQTLPARIDAADAHRFGAAYPIIVRSETVGLLLLGAKRDGEQFDALERAALQTLVEAAAMTYDHLESVEQWRTADQLRQELAQARRENDLLRGKARGSGLRPD